MVQAVQGIKDLRATNTGHCPHDSRSYEYWPSALFDIMFNPVQGVGMRCSIDPLIHNSQESRLAYVS